MPPKIRKDAASASAAATVLPPVVSGDHPGNDMASLRRELRSMAVELTTKLDTVLSNQEGILSRIAEQTISDGGVTQVCVKFHRTNPIGK